VCRRCLSIIYLIASKLTAAPSKQTTSTKWSNTQQIKQTLLLSQKANTIIYIFTHANSIHIYNQIIAANAHYTKMAMLIISGNEKKQTQSFTLARKQIKVTARTDRSNASTQHFKAHVIEASNTAIWLSCCHRWMRRPAGWEWPSGRPAGAAYRTRTPKQPADKPN